jgi:hypothetical protein
MDPLFNRGWIEFNERHWGVRAELIELGPRSGSAWLLRAVLYSDRHGRLVMPPRNAYLPVSISCDGARGAVVNARKREAISALAEWLYRKRIPGGLSFSPVVSDIRAFQSRGFDAVPRYTYHIDLHDFDTDADPSVRNKIRKAQRNGYVCEVSTDFEAVQDCLRGPESRKDFDHLVDARGLAQLLGLMGPDAFAAVLCRSNSGAAVGARLHVYCPGGMAYDWSAGVKTEALRAGVNNLLCNFSLRLFADRGCNVFDFCGANIPSVATAKEAWGGRLVTYYSLRPRSLRNVLRQAYLWARPGRVLHK